MSILTYENGPDVLIASIEPKTQIIKGINVDVNSSNTKKLRAASLMEQLGINTEVPIQGNEDKQKLIDSALTQKTSFESYASVSASLTDAIVAGQIAKELGLNIDRVLSNGGNNLDSDLLDLYNQKLDVLDVPKYCDDNYPMNRFATQLDVDESIADNIGDVVFGLHRATQQDVDSGIADDVDEIITVAEIVNGNEVRPTQFLELVKTEIFLPKLVTIANKKASMLDSELHTLILSVCNDSFKSNPIVPDLSIAENTEWSSRFSG